MKTNRLSRGVCFLTMVSTMLTAQVRRTPDAAVLKHWAAPLYWQPQATAASLPPSANPLVFVAMTPCRVVDTRGSQGFHLHSELPVSPEELAGRSPCNRARPVRSPAPLRHTRSTSRLFR